MADTQTVINTFTKKEERMRRNTRDTRWVSTNGRDVPTHRPGPGKAVQFRTQQPHHVSRSAPKDNGTDRSEASHNPAQSPVLTAAIYNVGDLQDLPDPYNRLPSARSWSSLRGSVRSYDGAVSPRTVTPSGRTQVRLPVLPMHDHFEERRNNPFPAAGPVDLIPTEEERKESNATIFPHFPTSIKNPVAKSKTTQGTQAPWNFTDFYRNAKEIYDAVPRGEGQKVCASYERPTEKKQDHTVVEQVPLKQMPASRRSSVPGLSAHPPSRPTQIAMSEATRESPSTYKDSHLLQDSAISRTSCKVPVRIGPDIQQVIDVSKPLPPVPRLQSTPKSKLRAGVKSSRPTKPAVASNIIGTAASGVQYLTQWRGSDQSPQHDSRNTKYSKAIQWWKSLTPLIPEDDGLIAPHGEADTNKAKISSPRPFTTILDGRTVNIALDCGGVGGPGTAAPYPAGGSHAPSILSAYSAKVNLNQVRWPPHGRMSERQKGEPKASHEHTRGLAVPKSWRDKLTSPVSSASKSAKQNARSRKDSDASFACQGVPQTYQAFVREPGPSTQFSKELEIEDEYMLPEPLFSGVRGGKEGFRYTRLSRRVYISASLRS